MVPPHLGDLYPDLCSSAAAAHWPLPLAVLHFVLSYYDLRGVGNQVRKWNRVLVLAVGLRGKVLLISGQHGCAAPSNGHTNRILSYHNVDEFGLAELGFQSSVICCLASSGRAASGVSRTTHFVYNSLNLAIASGVVF